MSKNAPPTGPCDCNGGAPADGSTTPCPYCWNQDCENEIDVNSYGRYFRKYRPDGTEYSYSFTARYKVLAPVQSGSTITVQVRCREDPQEGVTAAEVAAVKARLENGVNTYWNNILTLEANDPHCGTKTFNVHYEIVWVTSDEHYTIRIYDTYPREGVTGDVMEVSKTTTAWTFAHEFGHCIGEPDEYAYERPGPDTVKYIKPDGSLDVGISSPYDGKPSTAPDATIMSSVNISTVLVRHGWNVAIEVQELLTDTFERPITCTIS